MIEATLGFDALQSRLLFTGKLIARTGLRIGAGRDTDVAGHDLPVMRDANGYPFIPGASFKGVLRAQIEALLRGLSDDASTQRRKLACYVLERRQRCIPDDTIREWRATMDAEEIGRHCRALIAGYKRPRSIEVRTEPLPLSSVNKINKALLRAPFWTDRTRQVN